MNNDVLDSIAERHGYPPVEWTPEKITDLCHSACSKYANGEGIIAPLRAVGIEHDKDATALKKEIKKIQDSLKQLEVIKTPSKETQDLIQQTRKAIDHLESRRDFHREWAWLKDKGITEENEMRAIGAPPGGENGPGYSQLIHDLAAAHRINKPQASRTDQARTVCTFFDHHHIPYSSEASIVQKLRNAEINN